MPASRCLGKRPPKDDPRTLKLAAYLPAKLPPPPEARDWSNSVKKWGLMGNSVYGDCTIAAVAHAVQVWTDNTTVMVTVPDATIIDYYSEWDGYDPKRPETDRGGYEIDVLNQWRRDGFAGHKLLAYAALDPQHVTQVKQAVCLFAGAYIGIALPTSCQRQSVWDAAPNNQGGAPGSWGGHAVYIVGYDHIGPTCITWGALQKMTWSFWLKYVDEAYALLADDFLGHYPAGETVLAALRHDLKAVTR